MESLAAQQIQRRLGTGSSLPDTSRFSRWRGPTGVRIHTDSAADQAAALVGASALTVDRHILFARGAFAPQTSEGGALLRHELVHTQQQPSAAERPSLTGPIAESSGHAESEARVFAEVADSHTLGAPKARVAAGTLLCSPASDFVSGHTRWALLNTEQAGADLLQRALQGDADFVQQVFDEVSWSSRDDVAFAFAVVRARVGIRGGLPLGRSEDPIGLAKIR